MQLAMVGKILSTCYAEANRFGHPDPLAHFAVSRRMIARRIQAAIFLWTVLKVNGK